MEDYKAFGSRTIHDCFIAARTNGIFTNPYRSIPDINVSGVATRHNVCLPSHPNDGKDDFRNSAIRYDVRRPIRPYEVNNVVGNTTFLPIQVNGDAETFKESFGMIKNA